MTLSYSAVESLFGLGRFEQIVVDCTDRLRDVLKLGSQEHQILIAEAMARTGRADFGKQIARFLLSRPECNRCHARCEMVLGLIARDVGRIEEATQHLQLSLRVARDTGDTAQAARSALALFRIVSERQTPEVVGSLLTEVRQLTIRAADPHLTALLHESVARQEAQVGNLEQARRHLRIAYSLLEAHPNVWLRQLCEINEFCIDFVDSKLAVAEQHLEKAKQSAALSGAFKETILNNLGHLYLQGGTFVKAERILVGIANSRIDEVRQSALDGLARLFLATGRLDDCERVIERLSELPSRSTSTMSFPVRSSLVTQTRLLLRQRKWSDAARTADVAIQEAERLTDRKIATTALILRAQAMLAVGRDFEASQSLVKATELGAWSMREQIGMSWQVCSEVYPKDSDLRTQAKARARRIWTRQGNECAKKEFEHASDNGNRICKVTASDHAFELASSILNSLVSVFDLSHDARLIGDELTDAIRSMDCSPNVRITTARHSVTNDRSCALVLGRHGQETFALRCEIPSEPAKALMLSNIMRLGRAALALEHAREEERNRAALWPADPVETQEGAIFLAEEMQSILNVARRIAPTNVPVLITGETGTGKEVLARTIHAYSNRAHATFLPFNCTSTPKDMLDSQLFGHRRGAFTGAVENFQGVVRAASGGTLFLDEIGDTSLDVQPKLLRFLESNEIHPIGETQPTRVDVRVVVATNADLESFISQGRFREDLFYRLSIVRLHLPPLRERRVEIPTLAHHYLHKYAQEYGKGDLRLAEDTMEYLVLYRWPGNTRQLANEMRRLAALAESGAVLMPEHLAPEIAASRRTIPASERVLDPTEVVVRLDQPMAAAMQHVEQTMIQYALNKCGGRIEETAAMLGISRKGLYLKRQRFGIEPPQPAAAVAGA